MSALLCEMIDNVTVVRVQRVGGGAMCMRGEASE